VRHALRRCALAIVAVVFAATAAGRPFAALAMAEHAVQHAGREADDCSHQHSMPSHGSMPGGPCCPCCGPVCGACAPSAPAPAASGFSVTTSFVAPQASRRVVRPRAAVSLRLPPAIGPPSAPVA